MEISVVIAVYNANLYLRQAVESAVTQSEAAEVILIEDGSTDDSLVLCQTLAAEYSKVKVYRHPDYGNHGLSASRNLGIEKATTSYIAFLDADDYFLPNRFEYTHQLFETDSTLDGVYEAVGTHFESEAARQRWDNLRKAQRLTTMKEQIPPEALFKALTLQRSGVGKFSMIGLVIKRSLFERTGYFDHHLRLSQDTAMIIKMAAMGRLVGGKLNEPVSMRRVHEANRSSAERSPTDIFNLRQMVADTLVEWGKTHVTPAEQRLLTAYWVRIQKERPLWGRPPTRTSRVFSMLALGLRRPSVLFSPYYWWEFIPKS